MSLPTFQRSVLPPSSGRWVQTSETLANSRHSARLFVPEDSHLQAVYCLFLSATSGTERFSNVFPFQQNYFARVQINKSDVHSRQMQYLTSSSTSLPFPCLVCLLTCIIYYMLCGFHELIINSLVIELEVSTQAWSKPTLGMFQNSVAAVFHLQNPLLKDTRISRRCSQHTVLNE
jgi:hypothetical protein